MVFASLAVWALPQTAIGAVEDDLSYLGYSRELTDFAKKNLARPDNSPSPQPPQPDAYKETPVMKDADAVQEQLTELGYTRSLTPETPSNVEESKARLHQFWNSLNDTHAAKHEPLPAEFKEELKSHLTNSLTEAGFQVKQFDLIDVPNEPKVRGVVRVTRPVKSKNPYKEIQQSLSQIKDICMEGSTLDGVTYLSELTSFVAENPQNKYYYEKAVLHP